MKTRFRTILPGIVLVFSVTFISWKDIQKGNDMPEDISKILNNSCYGCHSAGAKSGDAVKALDFKKWEEYSATRKVAKLNGIKEVLKEDFMPPEKFLKKYPEKALSDEEKDRITGWADGEIAKLME